MNPQLLVPHKEGIVLSVRVSPRASTSRIAGVIEGELKVSLHAPPTEGQANRELLRVLSKSLSIPKSRMEILSGETSRSKRVLIRDVSLEEIVQALRKFSQE